MLNNLTNFFNLIIGRRIKKTLEPSDLIAVGTKQSPALGDYKPTAIKFSDLQAQLGGGGTTSYKVYTALLTQSGTDDPVATVLENTLGTVTFTRTNVGIWLITSGSLFTIGKTIVTHQFGAGSSYIISVDANYDDSELYMEASNYNNGIANFEYTDGILTGGAYTHIEIRVYP